MGEFIKASPALAGSLAFSRKGLQQRGGGVPKTGWRKLPRDHEGMLILHVNIHVKPEFLDAFRAATIENARNSAREPGIARFDFLEHADDPHRFSLWEVYYGEEGVAAHKLTPHYAVWTETVTGMMAEPRTRTWYKSVFPADEAF